MASQKMIGFQWKGSFEGSGQTFAMSMEGIHSVSYGCSFGLHPVLPKGFCGMALCEGKILPVLDLRPVLGEHYLEFLLNSKNRDQLVALSFDIPKMMETAVFATAVVFIPGPVFIENEQSSLKDSAIFTFARLIQKCLGEERGEIAYGKSA